MNYWFKPKQFWKYFAAYYPTSWQGWVIISSLSFTAVIIFLIIDQTSHSVSDVLYNYLPWLIVLGLIFDWFCFRKGEYPTWWKKHH